MKNLANCLVDRFKSQHCQEDRNALLREIETMHTAAPTILDASIDCTITLTEMRRSYAFLLYSSEIEAAKKLRTYEDVRQFYKWEVYERRCKIEILGATYFRKVPVVNILFVGAGSMPISAIVASNAGYCVDAIDKDHEAAELGKQICNINDNKISYMKYDLFDFNGYYKYDLIVISGTVGITEYDKAMIAEHILNNATDKTTVCFRNPVREENLLMAPVPFISGLRRVEINVEEHNDYISRVYLSKN